MANLWFESALLPQGWVERVRVNIAGGRIQRIDAGVDRVATDEAHAVAIPGLPNLHSHAFQRGLAGLTERRGPEGDSFWTWRELMYQFVERLDPEDLEAIAALVYAEMLECGFTQVGEFHYLHHDRGGVAYANAGELAARIAAAARHTGIGLTLLPVFYAHSGFGGGEPTARQRRFINDRERFIAVFEASQRAVKDLPGATVGVAPHSLRAVTPDELKWLLELGRAGVIHIHIAEQTREVDDCIAWCGRRPVEWLLAHAQVDERWCLVHATHMNEAELQAVAASGAVVGLCPITEANLGDGIFPGPAFLARRGRFGVGSDSNVLLDAAEELRLFEYSQRLAHRARNVVAAAPGRSTGRALFDGALSGGAQVLGAPAGFVPGASADIVSLNTQDPALIQRRADDVLDSWIFAGGRRLIDCVWRAGEKMVSNGRHRHRDAIAERYRRTLQRLLS
ncbi:MAG TPA: formimidoylglutamate deiminase [Steroidobacteraceae bacterium]|nr:formimidoylglutamate deiminase [Steroidobacteraceae bacterium]